jgi:hypothetical protein
MRPRVRSFTAVAVISITAAGAAFFAQACQSSNPVALPSGPDGSTLGEEASADAPATSDVAESGGETSTSDGPAGDGGADSGDAAGDAQTGDAPPG